MHRVDHPPGRPSLLQHVRPQVLLDEDHRCPPDDGEWGVVVEVESEWWMVDGRIDHCSMAF